MLRIVLPLLVALSALSPRAIAAQDAQPAPVLRPGDVLRVTVWNNDRLSGDLTVAPDGTLVHPLYRSLQAAGVSLAELDARLRTFLQGFEENPRFVAEPLVRVTVGGEVRQPNLYRLPPETGVAQAIVLAGGATDRGRLSRVHLVRDGRVQVLDLTDPAGSGSGPMVRSGDYITVQRRTNVFRDYIAPAGGITAALVSLANLVINARKQ